ncbi:hypothetical protein [Fontibacter flavus]|uniref:Uncharacterized protein n=1 Tax=Fontibacter flavus TaxID=654838 RepID=A0ABV6FUF8_9BACT
MKKSEKILSTIFIIIGFFVIASLIQAAFMSSGEGNGSILVGLLFMGMIFGIQSIWKKKNFNSNDNTPEKR